MNTTVTDEDRAEVSESEAAVRAETPFRQEARAAVSDALASTAVLRVERRLRLADLLSAVQAWLGSIWFIVGDLSRFRRRVLTFVPQVDATDCGVACLLTVARYWGLSVTRSDVAARVTRTRSGVTARSLVEACREMGLSARGVRASLDDLRYAPRASILHWRLDHFVVLDRVTKAGVVIVDPAVGRRVVAHSELDRCFSGVALLIEGNAARSRARPDRSVWAPAKAFLKAPRLWAAAAVLSVVVQAVGLLPPLLTKAVVDAVVADNGPLGLPVIALGATGLLAALLLVAIARLLALSHLQARLDGDVTTRLFEHLMRLPYRYHLSHSTGDLLLRVLSMTSIREVLTSSVLSTLLDVPFSVVYTVVLLLVDPTMALAVAAFVTVQLVVVVAAWRPVAAANAEMRIAQARTQNTALQSLQGIETLKCCGAEQTSVDRWTNLYVHELNAGLVARKLNAVMDGFLSMSRVALPVVLLLVGAHRVASGDLSPGDMLAAVALGSAVSVPVLALAGSAMRISALRSAFERIVDVLGSEPEPYGRGTTLRDFQGRVTAEAVSFRYHPGSPEVLDGLSLDVPPGTSIALVGRSGCGKSTFARVLCGLVTPTSGVLQFDGVDIDELDVASVRERVAVVTQSTTIFPGTVFENLTLACGGAGMAEVVAAAKAACIHDDITAMPLGYSTLLVDGGQSLSGGQRQRLAIARVLLARPALIVLDEATSALDSVTELAVLEALGRADITRVVISHRLSTTMATDQVAVMVNGRIVEHGQPRSLLASRGHYWSHMADQADIASIGETPADPRMEAAMSEESATGTTEYPLAPEQVAALAVSGRAASEAAGVSLVSVERVEKLTLATALGKIVERHDALRMRLVEDDRGVRQRFLRPREAVLRPRMYAIPESGPEDDAVAAGLMSRLLDRPLDLVDEGPMRVAVAGVEGSRGLLGIAIDRVAIDGDSFIQVVSELEALVNDRMLPSEDSPGWSYARYVGESAARVGSERVAKNTAWWITEADRTTSIPSTLPVLNDAASVPGPRAQVDLSVPAAKALDRASGALRCTPSAVLLASVGGALVAHGVGSPLLVTIPATPGRALAPRTAVGNFTIPLPLVVDVSGDLSQDARHIGETVVRGLLRSQYCVATWRAALRERVATAERNPLSIVFLYRDVSLGSSRLDRPAGDPSLATAKGVLFPPNHLEFWFERRDGTLSGFVRYSDSWYPRELIDSLGAEITGRLGVLEDSASNAAKL